MSDFLSFARERVLLLDGAMGSQIQARNLTLDDFWGQENCSEILNLSRPELIREIHKGYLLAGSDAVETNSFGGSPITLGEFGLEEKALEINELAARLAREAIEEVAGDGRPRFVVGSIGPGTKLPSLDHIGYGELEASFAVQAEGLMLGGSDALLIETCQDPLQIKAAVNGCRHAFVRQGRELPLMVQVTIETTGTMLVGTDIAAATTIINAEEYGRAIYELAQRRRLIDIGRSECLRSLMWLDNFRSAVVRCDVHLKRLDFWRQHDAAVEVPVRVPAHLLHTHGQHARPDNHLLIVWQASQLLGQHQGAAMRVLGLGLLAPLGPGPETRARDLR